jgi:hypothetical protein
MGDTADAGKAVLTILFESLRRRSRRKNSDE